MHGLQLVIRGARAGVYRDEQAAHQALVYAWGLIRSARYKALERAAGCRIRETRAGLGIVARAVLVAAAADGFRLEPVNVGAGGAVEARRYADAMPG